VTCQTVDFARNGFGRALHSLKSGHELSSKAELPLLTPATAGNFTF